MEMNDITIIWHRLIEEERNHLLKLLFMGKRIDGIKYVRQAGGLGLSKARAFIDSGWMRNKLVNADPTRMSPKDEFKAKVLRIVTNMLSSTINDPDMLAKDKYKLLTHDVTKLFDLCMED